MVVFCVWLGSPAEPQEARQEKSASPGSTAKEGGPVTVDEARRRAKLLHETYVATLQVMHRYYFKDEERTVPSRALEDVFSRVASRQKVHANWIAVSARAMSIDNVPKTKFEKRAARELRRGKNEFEQVADGEFRRAGAVVLFANCIRCHETRARSPVAGLVIRMPVVEK